MSKQRFKLLSGSALNAALASPAASEEVEAEVETPEAEEEVEGVDAEDAAEAGGKDKDKMKKKGAPADDDDDEGPDAEDDGDDEPMAVVDIDTAAQLQDNAATEATAAANARVEKVFSSEAALSNPADAAFMLCNSTASADKIIGHLEGKQAAAPATSAASTDAGIDDVEVDLGIATEIDGATTADAKDDPWDGHVAAAAAAQGITLPTAGAANPLAADAGGVGGQRMTINGGH